MYRSVNRDVPSVFFCIGTGARACDRHIPNVMTQTYRHIRDKMAVVAVSLATIADSLAVFLLYIHKWVWSYKLYSQSKKKYLVINGKLSRLGSECILALRKRAPGTNAESDIMREKMNGKQTGTRLGTRPPAYYYVTGMYRHIPLGHANKCSHCDSRVCSTALRRNWQRHQLITTSTYGR